MQQEDKLINYKHLIVNLFSTTLTNVLYYFELYSKDVFEIKTVVSLQTYAIKQSVLLDYVVKLQEQIMNMFNAFTCIEVQLLVSNEPFISFFIHINQDLKFLQSSPQLSVFEKDMSLKTATHQIQKFLQKQNKHPGKNLTFQIKFSTNGEEVLTEESQTNITENWIRQEQVNKNESAELQRDKQINEQRLVDSIHYPGFNVGLSMKIY